MTPWWIHQYNKYGSFVRLNLGEGLVLYSGNNPINLSGGGNGKDVDKTYFDKNFKDPIKRNEAFKKAALTYIIGNQQHFIKMMGIKFLRFWRLYPYTDHYQGWHIILSSLLSYGLVLLLATGFLIRNIKNHILTLLPILGLISYLTLVHIVTISSIRYRFPLEPFLIIFAAHFLVDIGKKNVFLKKLKDKVAML